MEGDFENLDYLGVVLASLKLLSRVGLGLHTSGQELMLLHIPRQDNFSGKTALLRPFKSLDKIHLDQ